MSDKDKFATFHGAIQSEDEDGAYDTGAALDEISESLSTISWCVVVIAVLLAFQTCRGPVEIQHINPPVEARR